MTRRPQPTPGTLATDEPEETSSMASEGVPQWPDSTATDVTAVRGIQIPQGSGYNREEEWMWIEVNEDGTISTYRLNLQVTVEPPEDEEGSADE